MTTPTRLMHKSKMRLIHPSTPYIGDSKTLTTGRPPTWVHRECKSSNTKKSGTIYTDAVVLSEFIQQRLDTFFGSHRECHEYGIDLFSCDLFEQIASAPSIGGKSLSRSSRRSLPRSSKNPTIFIPLSLEFFRVFSQYQSPSRLAPMIAVRRTPNPYRPIAFQTSSKQDMARQSGQSADKIPSDDARSRKRIDLFVKTPTNNNAMKVMVHATVVNATSELAVRPRLGR